MSCKTSLFSFCPLRTLRYLCASALSLFIRSPHHVPYCSKLHAHSLVKLHGSPHLVPLPRQAVDLLQGLHPLTGRNLYVFRGERAYDRAMSENTINAALRRMGYSTKENITGNGFRATACTILDKRLSFDRAAIEAQLAHSVKDLNGRAYNRTEFVEQRRTMLQAWANYLDTLRQGNVLPLRAHSG